MCAGDAPPQSAYLLPPGKMLSSVVGVPSFMGDVLLLPRFFVFSLRVAAAFDIFRFS